MQFSAIVSLALAGSAFAMPGMVARSFSTSVATPSVSGSIPSGPIETNAPPAVQAAESKYYADYNSYLTASGSAKQAIYSSLNPDLQAIQSAKNAAFSSVAASVSATPTPARR